MLLDEHFRIEGRKTFYEAIEQMQKNLDAFLLTHNTKRPHQGRGMKGRTPELVFKAGRKPALQQSKTRRKWHQHKQPEQPLKGSACQADTVFVNQLF